MKKNWWVCLVMALIMSLLIAGVQAQGISAQFYFDKPDTVKPGDKVTISWDLQGGKEPYTIDECSVYFVHSKGYSCEPLDHGDCIEVDACDYFYVRMVVTDSDGVQTELESEKIQVDSSEPYTCSITLNKSSLALGETITATWQYTGGRGYGEWVTVDDDNNISRKTDWESFDIKSGSSSFVPTLGTRGYFQLKIEKYDGSTFFLPIRERSDLFTIVNGKPVGRISCDVTFDKPSVLPGEEITAYYTLQNASEPVDFMQTDAWVSDDTSLSTLHPISEIKGKSMTLLVPREAVSLRININGHDAQNRPFSFSHAVPLRSAEDVQPLAARVALDQSSPTRGSTLTGRLIIQGGRPPYTVHAGSSYYLPLNMPYGEDYSFSRFEAEQGPEPTVDGENISLEIDTGGKGWFDVYITDADGMRTRVTPYFIVQEPAPPRQPGDANGDELVDIRDLTAVLDHILETGNLESLANADANDDGQVDINDLIWIIEQIVN